MTQTVLVAIITGVFTLGGVLGSQYLTQRSAGRRAREERTEADRRELRTDISVFLRACRRWTASTWSMGVYVATQSNRPAAMGQWISDPGNAAQIEDAETVALVGGRLLLTIADPTLHDLFRSLMEYRSGEWTQSVEKANEKQIEMDRRLDEIEARAAEVLRGTV